MFVALGDLSVCSTLYAFRCFGNEFGIRKVGLIDIFVEVVGFLFVLDNFAINGFYAHFVLKTLVQKLNFVHHHALFDFQIYVVMQFNSRVHGWINWNTCILQSDFERLIFANVGLFACDTVCDAVGNFVASILGKDDCKFVYRTIYKIFHGVVRRALRCIEVACIHDFGNQGCLALGDVVVVCNLTDLVFVFEPLCHHGGLDVVFLQGGLNFACYHVDNLVVGRFLFGINGNKHGVCVLGKVAMHRHRADDCVHRYIQR